MPCIAIGPREEEEEEEEQEEEEEAEAEGEKVSSQPAPATLRVLFVDVDGVLNTRPDTRQLIIEATPCIQLRRLLEASGAQLVLTTPWRRHQAYVTQVLQNFGTFSDEESPEVGSTPFNADETRRDLEILQWLNARRGQVAAWAVLDTGDLLRFPSAARFEGHFVRVAGEHGLQAEHTQAALEAMGGPLKPKQKEISASSAGVSAHGNLSHLAMDEELANMMGAMLSVLPSGLTSNAGKLKGGGSFLQESNESSKSSAGKASKAASGDGSEFDRMLQDAKQRFG
eukprot:TRINITY_DN7694_c0_g1_i1.p1 TRINITY_DN7694_c0_g1~~TRINITY_DN7694_c0_g1_i1.p1  ORF type:complete len:284 (+),score=73.85 TRINITY_DN7694_c0_g1_i1:62-913(+)